MPVTKFDRLLSPAGGPSRLELGQSPAGNRIRWIGGIGRIGGQSGQCRHPRHPSRSAARACIQASSPPNGKGMHETVRLAFPCDAQHPLRRLQIRRTCRDGFAHRSINRLPSVADQWSQVSEGGASSSAPADHSLPAVAPWRTRPTTGITRRATFLQSLQKRFFLAIAALRRGLRPA